MIIVVPTLLLNDIIHVKCLKQNHISKAAYGFWLLLLLLLLYFYIKWDSKFFKRKEGNQGENIINCSVKCISE